MPKSCSILNTGGEEAAEGPCACSNVDEPGICLLAHSWRFSSRRKQETPHLCNTLWSAHLFMIRPSWPNGFDQMTLIKSWQLWAVGLEKLISNKEKSPHMDFSPLGHRSTWAYLEVKAASLVEMQRWRWILTVCQAKGYLIYVRWA